MGSGEWGVGSGEWGVGSGEWGKDTISLFLTLLRFRKVSLQIELIGNESLSHRRRRRGRRGSAEALCVSSAFSAPAAVREAYIKPCSNFVN